MKNTILLSLIIIMLSVTIYAGSNPFLFLLSKDKGYINLNFIKIQSLWNANPQVPTKLLDIGYDNNMKAIVVQFIPQNNKKYKMLYKKLGKDKFIQTLKNNTIDIFRKVYPYIPLRFNWSKILKIEIINPKEGRISFESKLKSKKRYPKSLMKIISRNTLSNIDIQIIGYLALWNSYYAKKLPFIKIMDANYNKSKNKVVFSYILDEEDGNWLSLKKQIGEEDSVKRLQDQTIEFFKNRVDNNLETNINWGNYFRIEVYSLQTKKMIVLLQDNIVKKF